MKNSRSRTAWQAQRLHDTVDEEEAIERLPRVLNFCLELAAVWELGARREHLLEIPVVEHVGGSARRGSGRKCSSAHCVEWSLSGASMAWGKLSLIPCRCFLAGASTGIARSRVGVSGWASAKRYVPATSPHSWGGGICLQNTPTGHFQTRSTLTRGQADQPEQRFLVTANTTRLTAHSTILYILFHSNVHYTINTIYAHLDEIQEPAHHGDSPDATRYQTNGHRRIGG